TWCAPSSDRRWSTTSCACARSLSRGSSSRWRPRSARRRRRPRGVEERVPRIAVTSPSFAAHLTLRAELEQLFPDVIYNETGRRPADVAPMLVGADAAIVGRERIDGAV